MLTCDIWRELQDLYMSGLIALPEAHTIWWAMFNCDIVA